MPKPTFLNLSPEKRDRIVELAIDEFSRLPYQQASLSRIVARAGIAKGSIYQYFDNKLDLYRWLLTQEVPRRKLGYMQARAAAVAPRGFVATLRSMVSSGMRFMLDNPRLAQLGSAVTLPTADPQLRELYREVQGIGRQGFAAMISAAREKGELRDDVALDTVVDVLSVLLTSGVRAVVLGRLGVDVHDLFERRDHEGDGARGPLDDATLDAMVDEVVDLVFRGVGPRQ